MTRNHSNRIIVSILFRTNARRNFNRQIINIELHSRKNIYTENGISVNIGEYAVFILSTIGKAGECRARHFSKLALLICTYESPLIAPCISIADKSIKTLRGCLRCC